MTAALNPGVEGSNFPNEGQTSVPAPGTAATKPRPKAFWPGYRWRVYAHFTKKRGGKDPGYTGESIDLRSDRHGDLVEFDELVIDDWFHLEQMNERDWWLGVGNGDDYWHVNVHIDRDGKASVQMEKQ